MASPSDDEVAEPSFFTRTVFSSLLNAGNNLTLRKDFTINRRLSNFLALKVGASSKPSDGISSKDIVIDNQYPDKFVRIFTPSQQDSKKLPVIVYFHGGGFATLAASSKSFDMLCRALAKIYNAIVVSVNYRLAPEFPHPTAYDDCYEALQWLQSDCESGDLSSIVDPSRCFFMGDSAGGNICHFMMVKAVQNGLSPLRLRGVAMLSPFFGGVERTSMEIKTGNEGPLHLWVTDWFWKAFLPPGSDRDHGACNVFGPNADDISGLSLPPMLVMIGSMDILKDWQDRYVEKLKGMGKEVHVQRTNLYHAEYTVPTIMPKVLSGVADFFLALSS